MAAGFCLFPLFSVISHWQPIWREILQCFCFYWKELFMWCKRQRHRVNTNKDSFPAKITRAGSLLEKDARNKAERGADYRREKSKDMKQCSWRVRAGSNHGHWRKLNYHFLFRSFPQSPKQIQQDGWENRAKSYIKAERQQWFQEERKGCDKAVI